MQKNLNNRSRSLAYTLLNVPSKMFKVQPTEVVVPRTIKLDFNKRTPVRPFVQVRPNFVTVNS